MAVHWKPLPDGVKIPQVDYTVRDYSGCHQKPAGTGKKKCPLCGYRVRGNEQDHENGYHHQHPKKKS